MFFDSSCSNALLRLLTRLLSLFSASCVSSEAVRSSLTLSSSFHTCFSLRFFFDSMISSSCLIRSFVLVTLGYFSLSMKPSSCRSFGAVSSACSRLTASEARCSSSTDSSLSSAASSLSNIKITFEVFVCTIASW